MRDFFPKKKSEREKVLVEISKNVKTTILFESPHRLKKLLYELKAYCGEEREILISRELTKKFEETIGNNIKQVISYFESREIIGELTIVIKGVNKEKRNINYNKLELQKDLHELTKGGLNLSAASKYLAKKNNLKKSIIYNMF